MGFFDFLKNNPSKTFKTKEAPKVMINKTSPYSANPSKNYKSLAREGYQDNSIVHRCVQLISNSASAVDLCLYQGEEKIETHQLLTLLSRPNPLQSGTEFFSSLYSFLMISGNSYILRDTDNLAPAKELYLLRPDRIKIKSNTSMIPQSYCYEIDGVTLKEYSVDSDNGFSQIKQIKLWNPIDDFYGLSPLRASAYNIDQHNLAGLHNVALIKNGCTPSGMLKFQPTDETGQSTTLTDVQRSQLLDDLENKFTGGDTGRPMLLEGNFEYTQLGLNPKDMDFMELSNLSAREIALAFGVPAQLIGIPEANTYSNMETARLGFYEETIIPLLKRVESDLNEYLIPLYEDNIYLKYDIDSIPAMAEKTKQVYENIIGGVNAGILTRNEARERLGLEAVEGGDDLYINANQFPIGEDTEDNDPPDSEKSNVSDYHNAYGVKERVGFDEYTTREEAQDRADEIGCTGIHTHEYADGRTIYMPCQTHADYLEALQEGDKALADIDTTPTESMSNNAKRGLEMREEFGRGGTSIGVARANQLVRREKLSIDTVLRMFSFFSRHEVDKQAEGFNSGEEGYPSAGKIAWMLWGSDSGFSWAKRKRDEIMREREKSMSVIYEEKAVAGVGGSMLEALKGKVKEHNDKHGDKKGKRVTVGMLARVFKRGIGAYRNNPGSVRPSVRRQGGEDRWALARVNTFLSAVRTGRFPGGKFDLDLLPKDHPMSSRD